MVMSPLQVVEEQLDFTNLYIAQVSNVVITHHDEALQQYSYQYDRVDNHTFVREQCTGKVTQPFIDMVNAVFSQRTFNPKL